MWPGASPVEGHLLAHICHVLPCRRGTRDQCGLCIGLSPPSVRLGGVLDVARVRSAVEAVLADRPRNTVAAGRGPRGVLRSLALLERSAVARREWAEEARLDAILGSCSLSMKSLRSGVRCFVAFVSTCGGGRGRAGRDVRAGLLCRCKGRAWVAAVLPPRLG